jgi:predicted  nucleic acid-binding Zn-ribbon protein
MKKILFFLFFLLIPGLSFGEVYKWVDDKGGIHFTDDLIQIPEKYRPQIERLGPSVERDQTLPKKKDESYRDRLGKGEDYWKGRVEEWNKKLKDAQEKVNNLRVKYNELTEKFNESKNSVERTNLRKERDQIKSEMDKYKTQTEEAKDMLEKKIPGEAAIFGAKPEWIKQ